MYKRLDSVDFKYSQIHRGNSLGHMALLHHSVRLGQHRVRESSSAPLGKHRCMLMPRLQGVLCQHLLSRCFQDVLGCVAVRFCLTGSSSVFRGQHLALSQEAIGLIMGLPDVAFSSVQGSMGCATSCKDPLRTGISSPHQGCSAQCGWKQHPIQSPSLGSVATHKYSCVFVILNNPTASSQWRLAADNSVVWRFVELVVCLHWAGG